MGDFLSYWFFLSKLILLTNCFPLLSLFCVAHIIGSLCESHLCNTEGKWRKTIKRNNEFQTREITKEKKKKNQTFVLNNGMRVLNNTIQRIFCCFHCIEVLYSFNFKDIVFATQTLNEREKKKNKSGTMILSLLSPSLSLSDSMDNSKVFYGVMIDSQQHFWLSPFHSKTCRIAKASFP